MTSSLGDLVTAVHNTPWRLVLAVSGGGAAALGALLEVPGASRTVLEAVIPYSEESMAYFLGGNPDQHCSAETARAMAMVGFRRACRYSRQSDAVAGISCTASLATDRPKRGPHRAHLAIQNAAMTVTWWLELEKGRRSRKAEEDIVSRLILNAVAEACEVQERLDLDLLDSERIERAAVVASRSWQDLLLGRVEAVHHGGSPRSAEAGRRAIFPGAFNPLHDGHRGMALIAEEILHLPVEFEISIFNVDKPPLDYCEIDRRRRQFTPQQSLWLTAAPTFEEKSRLFPRATFLIGSDTLVRIADPRYYGNDVAAWRAAVGRIVDRGCNFLVFGRDSGSRFASLSDLDLPEPLRSICREVPQERFRADISSTEIRRSQPSQAD